MYKIGIIGLGRRIAEGVLPPLFDLSDDVIVTAIADPDENKVKETIKGGRFYANDINIYISADEMLDSEELDGIMIGTRCNLHTEMAIKCMKKNIPIFLEKPVCISEQQLSQLIEAEKKYNPRVVVSFPLRFSEIAVKVKELIDSGVIGDVIQVDAFNDVPYGRVYYRNWYRDESVTGGLWLQKATHDFDYLNYILGDIATEVFAMESRTIFGGDMPAGSECETCGKKTFCTESPYVVRNIYHDPRVGSVGKWCAFAVDTGNHDCGTALVRYAKGAIVKYHQNFFARHKAERRGARFYGYKGTLEFDWYKNEIKVYMHTSPRVDSFTYYGDGTAHFGGDQYLSKMYLDMLSGQSKISYLNEGMQSANMCLCARKSCETGQKVVIPKL